MQMIMEEWSGGGGDEGVSLGGDACGGLEKSRKEKRKEARLAKKQHKHSVWLQKQKSGKLKRSLRSSLTENLDMNDLGEEGEISVMESDSERDDRPSEAKMIMASVADLRPEKKISRRKGEKLKRKKTKFEEYLEMGDNNGVVAAEEDLEMERRLVKKLKLKNGILRGEDDGMALFFEGVPSILDSFEEEYDQHYVDGVSDTKSIEDKNNENQKKKKRRKDKMLDRELEDPVGDAFGNNMCEDNELVESQNEDTDSEECAQIRRRVRGLLNRLSESNVESGHRRSVCNFPFFQSQCCFPDYY
ncbi:hypothetical protein Ancab_015130 [Ancistrocladus abbreviatus]